MKRTMTVKENYEFRRIYAKGRSGVSPYLVVYVRPNRRGRNRLGVTVSTKLGTPWCATASAAVCGKFSGSIKAGSRRGMI